MQNYSPVSRRPTGHILLTHTSSSQLETCQAQNKLQTLNLIRIILQQFIKYQTNTESFKTTRNLWLGTIFNMSHPQLCRSKGLEKTQVSSWTPNLQLSGSLSLGNGTRKSINCLLFHLFSLLDQLLIQGLWPCHNCFYWAVSNPSPSEPVCHSGSEGDCSQLCRGCSASSEHPEIYQC